MQQALLLVVQLLLPLPLVVQLLLPLLLLL
jgi:hypothetical protein